MIGLSSRRLLAGFPEAVLIVDDHGVLQWANQATADLTGRRMAELKGLHLDALIPARDLSRICRARAVGALDQLTRFHCALSTKSGEPREVSVSVGRLVERAGELRLYVLRDLRRQRDWEDRLSAKGHEVHELAAFGETSSRLVHDLRRLGHVLGLTLHNLRSHVREPGAREDAIRALEDVAMQMRHLVDDLCRSPTRRSLRPEGTTLGALVRSALDLVGRATPERHGVQTELRGLDQTLRCSVDIGEMQRVIANLLSNAYEAAAHRGAVILTGFELQSERAVCLVIEDTGPGIPPSYLERRIFRPFQSTKARGLGLGLYHAKAVVEAHGGSLGVANRGDRQGVRVTLTLPGVGGGYVAAEHSPRRG